MNGKVARTVQELKIDIPDLDKLEILYHKRKKAILFKKQETVIQVNKKIYIKAPENSSCIYCCSTDFTKNGLRKCKLKKIQIYRCRNCKRRFSFNVGFGGSKNSPESIAQALQLYFTGESIRNIATFLQMQGISVTHGAVFHWIKKYIKLMKVFLEQFTPQVSDKWRCDEIYLKIKGTPKWLFVLMDDETRFILAYYIADTKKTHKANKLFQMAIAKAQKKPTLFTSDSLPSYKKAFGEVFGPEIEHVRANYHTGTKWKNNLMERWNGTFRQRSKSFRAIKKMDSVTVHGFILYYNFIRRHSVIKSTPAEKAGIFIENEKWRTLIQNATMENDNLWRNNGEWIG